MVEHQARAGERVPAANQLPQKVVFSTAAAAVALMRRPDLSRAAATADASAEVAVEGFPIIHRAAATAAISVAVVGSLRTIR